MLVQLTKKLIIAFEKCLELKKVKEKHLFRNFSHHLSFIITWEREISFKKSENINTYIKKHRIQKKHIIYIFIIETRMVHAVVRVDGSVAEILVQYVLGHVTFLLQ